MTISFLGAGVGIGGQMGLEFLVFISAILAACTCWFEKYSASSDALSQLRTALTSTCLVFAAGEAVYIGFMTHIVQFGFGLPLMLIAACVMVYLDISKFPKASTSPVLPIATGALIFCMAFAGYKGYEVRKGVDTSALFPTNTGIPMSGNNVPSRVRDDVELKLNSTTQIASLTPTTDFYKPVFPEAGKIFLVCNVTVTFKGKDSLNVASNNFELNASNKQIYKSRTFFYEFQNFKEISATLLPEGTVTGNVLFEVDSNAQADKIDFVLW